MFGSSIGNPAKSDGSNANETKFRPILYCNREARFIVVLKSIFNILSCNPLAIIAQNRQLFPPKVRLLLENGPGILNLVYSCLVQIRTISICRDSVLLVLFLISDCIKNPFPTRSPNPKRKRHTSILIQTTCYSPSVHCHDAFYGLDVCRHRNHTPMLLPLYSSQFGRAPKLLHAHLTKAYSFGSNDGNASVNSKPPLPFNARLPI